MDNCEKIRLLKKDFEIVSRNLPLMSKSDKLIKLKELKRRVLVLITADDLSNSCKNEVLTFYKSYSFSLN